MDLGMSSVDIDMGQMWSSSGKQLHLYPSSYDVFPDDTDLQTEFPISSEFLNFFSINFVINCIGTCQLEAFGQKHLLIHYGTKKLQTS